MNSQHNAETIFVLIKSLEPHEKRHFKLYMKRLSDFDNFKVIQLFMAIDSSKNYNEVDILKKNPQIQKKQISNLKAHLFQSILTCLRLIKQKENIELQLNEQLDFAKIVYQKGMYLQSLKMLSRIKELATTYNQITYLIQAQFLEKKIESLHITRSMEQRAINLAKESETACDLLKLVNQISNHSLLLYSWYIKNGFVRNKQDFDYITNIFKSDIEPLGKKLSTFYDKCYYYQAYCWYSFIVQDFLNFYKYSIRWVQIFDQYPIMIETETFMYIKAQHNLITALFNIKRYEEFKTAVDHFEQFSKLKWVDNIPNNKIQCFVYLNIAKINQILLDGNIQSGIALIPQINKQLKVYELFLDKHRILVFYYKFASLYFAGAKYESCIDFLNKIINYKVNLRTDIQCYARFLLLIAHYELNNDYIIPYLIKSVYRFLLKMQNLNLIEQEILKFLQQFFEIDQRKLKSAFKNLLNKLKEIEKNKIDNRAIMYLDIIAWLESKLTGCTVAEIFQKRMNAKKL
ncbi:MAG: hypothetical protein QM539_00225 [Alphaproteobacteria bacterium]|nr:hypothetical protein [Alphaproteobacteria bacterium]